VRHRKHAGPHTGHHARSNCQKTAGR
jgi:hypothetical protein